MVGNGRGEVANVAVVGHVDHGKSTLVAAMAAVLLGAGGDTAAVPSVEAGVTREWGMVFRRAVAPFETDRRVYAMIDCPGNIDFVKSAVGGGIRLDGALLTVSAADGPMAHTRSQLALLRALDIPVVAVFLNKADAVADEGIVDRVERESRDMLDRLGFDGKRIPFVSGSALRAAADPSDGEAVAPIRELLGVLDETVCAAVPPPAEAPFLLPVDTAYIDAERGAVAVGTVERGTVSPGATIISAGVPSGNEWTVSEVRKGGRAAESAVAGDRVEISFPEEAREEVARGAVLAAPGSIGAAKSFRAVAYMLAAEEGGRRDGTPSPWTPKFQLRSAEVDGRVTLPEGTETILPGGYSEMDIDLGGAVALETKQRFGIKETGRTVGAGVVTGVAT